MAAESTRIVSVDRDQGGYNIDHVTGEFDGSNPAVIEELRSGTAPQTSFGFVEALRRRANRVGAFTVMSCDNLQGRAGPPGIYGLRLDHGPGTGRMDRP